MSGRTARAVVVAFLVAHHPAARAQDWSNVFHYGPQQLDCARVRETSRSRILAQSGGKDREQTAGRVARWNFRAAPAANGIGLEGWLDSLVLWRRSPETTIRPDTVFMPYHWAGRKSANQLTIAAQDPISKIPEYKVCAVKVYKAATPPEYADKLESQQ